jgi:hypothetical protein
MGLIVTSLVIVLGGGLVYFTGVIDKLTHMLMPAAEIEWSRLRASRATREQELRQALRN